MATAKPTPNFKRMMKGLSEGERVIPHVRAALWNPDFDHFVVSMPEIKTRKPDGFFHPSTHPTWPARMLFFYLTQPDMLIEEPFDPHSTMAVTQGHFWHEFIGTVLERNGVLKGREVKVQCDETGARGAMDGLLDDEVYEFKTMGRPFQMIPLLPPDHPDLLAHYKAKHPGYYYQGQEYMRMSGYRRHRTLILNMEYPFDMKEVVMPFDHAVVQEIADKYRAVRQAIADHRQPEPCCAMRSAQAKACPARGVCEIGTM